MRESKKERERERRLTMMGEEGNEMDLNSGRCERADDTWGSVIGQHARTRITPSLFSNMGRSI